jgi:hypothetical protein
MFDVKCTFTYLKADGSEAKPAYVREWEGLEKLQIIDQLELGYNRAMLKMTHLSSAIAKGHAPKPTTNTDPVEMRADILITEDGEKWLRTTHEWPKMSEEGQAAFLGVLEGELSTVGDEVKGAEKRSKAKKDKK